jgi:hypothetical protein
MRLHPEIPLVALLGLVQLGIARLVGILGRGRRIDDRFSVLCISSPPDSQRPTKYAPGDRHFPRRSSALQPAAAVLF